MNKVDQAENPEEIPNFPQEEFLEAQGSETEVQMEHLYDDGVCALAEVSRRENLGDRRIAKWAKVRNKTSISILREIFF